MRRKILLGLLVLLPSLAGAQEFIRYYPPTLGTTAPALTSTVSWTSAYPILFPAGTASAPAISASAEPRMGFRFDTGSFLMYYSVAGNTWLSLGSTGIGIESSAWLWWSSGQPGAAIADLYVKRAAANTLLQENGNAPQFSRISAGYSGYGETGTATEEITLATGATTTDSTANLLPAGAIIEAVTYRVTTTITTAASYSIGDATTVARFVSGSTGLVAGSTGTGLIQNNPTVADAAGPVQETAAKIRITTNANPGAGKIRIQVFYRFFGVPST